MSPRPNAAERRTAQIIQAATAAFAEKGFDGATMEDIADRAGINKATIYLYFDSKDALIYAIAEELFAQELNDLQAARDTPGSATERLAAYYEALIAEEADVLPVMPIFYEFCALSLRRDDVRAVLAAFLDQSAALLEAIIQEGVEQGEFAPTDARQAARTLDALLSGTLLHGIYAPGETDIAAQLRYGIRMLFRGMVAPA